MDSRSKYLRLFLSVLLHRNIVHRNVSILAKNSRSRVTVEPITALSTPRNRGILRQQGEVLVRYDTARTGDLLHRNKRADRRRHDDDGVHHTRVCNVQNRKVIRRNALVAHGRLFYVTTRDSRACTVDFCVLRSYRIENAAKIFFLKKKHLFYERMIHAIVFHQRAIELVLFLVFLCKNFAKRSIANVSL